MTAKSSFDALIVILEREIQPPAIKQRAGVSKGTARTQPTNSPALLMMRRTYL